MIEWLKEKVKCWMYGHEYILVSQLHILNGKLETIEKELLDCLRCADPLDKGWYESES